MPPKSSPVLAMKILNVGGTSEFGGTSQPRENWDNLSSSITDHNFSNDIDMSYHNLPMNYSAECIYFYMKIYSLIFG